MYVFKIESYSKCDRLNATIVETVRTGARSEYYTECQCFVEKITFKQSWASFKSWCNNASHNDGVTELIKRSLLGLNRLDGLQMLTKANETWPHRSFLTIINYFTRNKYRLTWFIVSMFLSAQIDYGPLKHLLTNVLEVLMLLSTLRWNKVWSISCTLLVIFFILELIDNYIIIIWRILCWGMQKKR